jgi:serine/threonine-protein kinase
MGVVYLAEHRHLGRPAAIKFLLRELSESPELLNRFFTEARAASLVEHDGIVRVFDCDVHASGNAYIVMEYLDGQTLRRYLGGRGPLPVPEATAIMLRVADARPGRPAPPSARAACPDRKCTPSPASTG